jgi:hypothetical protein
MSNADSYIDVEVAGRGEAEKSRPSNWNTEDEDR